MIRLPPYVLPALAVAFLLLCAVEFLLPTPGTMPRQNISVIPAQAGGAVDAAVSQWGENALARPLFHPDRRPVSAPGAVADDSLPRLSAIIIIGNSHAAIFSADGQKPQVVMQGDTIGAYRLERVGPDSVDLLGPDGITSIRPRFITTPAAAPAGAENINEENNN